MRQHTKISKIALVHALFITLTTSAFANQSSVQLDPQPFYLIEKMEESELKTTLQHCAYGPFYKTDFSIGHRGAALQFPEHTKESYEAAARMGAGILECDVTFTNDGELVCRHAQCDLHTTTDIVDREDLRKKCHVPPPTKATESPSFYYQSTLDALKNDGDLMVTLDVLAKDVGILGIFSDWPATVTYYVNCMGLK